MLPQGMGARVAQIRCSHDQVVVSGVCRRPCPSEQFRRVRIKSIGAIRATGGNACSVYGHCESCQTACAEKY
jgi:hypothetical protein